MSDITIGALPTITGTLPTGYMLFDTGTQTYKVSMATVAANFPEGPIGNTGPVSHRPISFYFNGSGALLAPQASFAVPVLFSGTISEVYIYSADGTSSTTSLDFWKTSAAGGFPTSSNSIIGTATVGLSGVYYNDITTFTGWSTTTIIKGDQLICNVKTNSATKNLLVFVVVAISGE